MTSQTGHEIISIHIQPSISRTIDKQVMKFGQLIEYSNNIFLERSYPKCVREASPRPVHQKSKLSISLAQQSEILYSWFLLQVHVDAYQKILNLKCLPRAFSLCKAFLKKQKRFGTSLPVLFSPWFLNKIFLALYSIT